MAMELVMLREGVVVCLIGVAGYWASTGLGGGYSRVVDRPPAQVAAALADLDIRDQPGVPGTDASASGGVLPTFTVERAADSVTWLVMSGDKVAVRMIAHLQPVDGGARTKVTAEVERGDAPDDYVSPAFRSKGVTMGLFSMALEDDLDELVFPAKEWGPRCDEIMARFEQRNAANFDQHNPQSLGQAFAGSSKAVMSIAAMDKELEAAGCPQKATSNAFVTPTAELREDEAPPPVARPQDATKPTTDLSRFR